MQTLHTQTLSDAYKWLLSLLSLVNCYQTQIKKNSVAYTSFSWITCWKSRSLKMRGKQMVNSAEYMSFTEWMLWNRIALQQKRSQFINKSAIKSKKPWSLFLFLRCFTLSKSSTSRQHMSHMSILSLPRLLLNLQSRIFTRIQGSEQCNIDVHSFPVSHPVRFAHKRRITHSPLAWIVSNHH